MSSCPKTRSSKWHTFNSVPGKGRVQLIRRERLLKSVAGLEEWLMQGGDDEVDLIAELASVMLTKGTSGARGDDTKSLKGSVLNWITPKGHRILMSLRCWQYIINCCGASKGDTYVLTKQFGQHLIDNAKEVIGRPPVYNDRVVAYDVSFVGMILPGDELKVNIRHVGMRDGNMVVKVEMLNQREENILEGTAEVAQATTIYGSQEPGMGMDLYNSSSAARAVWEGVDAHLLAVYGFSIVEIVKDNPKEKTIHFGGIKGQIALVMTEKAAFEDMCAKGFVQKNCAFAGHSLGEYSALASMADVLHIFALVDVVFYRRITMQRVIERDAHNRSNYAMVNNTFVLELLALQTMTNVLNYLKVQKNDIHKLTEQFTCREGQGDAWGHCDGVLRVRQRAAMCPSTLVTSGLVSCPPVHKINPSLLNPDMLIGKYIPNLVAKPFDITREHLPHLDKVLKRWDQDDWTSSEQRQKLAYTILVELLSYQFASPVHWIETQDLLFTHYHFDRFIELGPSPTPTGMATRTLKAKYEAQDDTVSRKIIILCHAKNDREIYYQFEDEVVATPAAAEAPVESTPALAAPAAAPTPVVASPLAGPAASIEDAPIKANNILMSIIAQKLKKKIEEVSVSKTIKDLISSKSTLQNEILGDLQLELSSAPEKGDELPLEELGSALSVGHSGALGKYTSGLVSCLIGGKMPGGFTSSTINAHLAKTWGLGSSRADGVLLLGTTMEPAKCLSLEAEGKAWLDTVVTIHAQHSGISLSSGGAGGAGSSSGGGATINSKGFLKFRAEQEQFATQHVELAQLQREMHALEADGRDVHEEYVSSCATDIEKKLTANLITCPMD
ncbi:acyl transferase domain-containing protein [Suillus subalutaceus]|uniref:acyl transferase domain-containing protein n=1 Tax=Suillus subalutaceus TaxID=48586 RepID=UPI001B87108B|nr:acyl transferase domain-containing protein [Suillus subalutaceus]KAG1835332.1 acyl transferase domain-containing protein [Suillus subalutaceus]